MKGDHSGVNLQKERSYTSLSKLTTTKYKPRYMADTVSNRMKQFNDEEFKRRTESKLRQPRKLRPLKTPWDYQSHHTMKNEPSAEPDPRPKTPYWWRKKSQQSTFLPLDDQQLSESKKQSLRMQRAPSIPAQRREFSARSPSSAAYQLPAWRVSPNRYNHEKPQNKGSMFSLNVNNQIREKFGKHDLGLQAQNQPQHHVSEYQRSPSYSYNYPQLTPETQEKSAIENERSKLLRKETSPSVKEVIKKLNEKVNKLYSWQISELDLVARLAGEIQELKRPISQAASTSALSSSPHTESLISNRLGKILLKTLSTSLQKIATEAQEEKRERALSPDNFTSLRKEIKRLSQSLRATGAQEEKVQIIGTYDLETSSNIREQAIDIKPFHEPAEKSKPPRVTTMMTKRVKNKEPQAFKNDEKLNTHHIPLILEQVANISVTPVTPSPVTKTYNLVTPQPQPSKSISSEVGHWIGELNDEIIAAKMTLKHIIELTTDPEGQRTQQFKDFAHMIQSCNMLQPFLLPDGCTNWLINASEHQVGVICELTELLHSVKQFIKSLVEEKDLDAIRNIQTAIQRSLILDNPLPSLNSNIS